MFGLQRGRYIFFPNYNLRTLNIYSGPPWLHCMSFHEKLEDSIGHNRVYILMTSHFLYESNLYLVYSLSCQTDYVYSLSPLLKVDVFNPSHSGSL